MNEIKFGNMELKVFNINNRAYFASWSMLNRRFIFNLQMVCPIPCRKPKNGALGLETFSHEILSLNNTHMKVGFYRKKPSSYKCFVSMFIFLCPVQITTIIFHYWGRTALLETELIELRSFWEK